VIAKPLKVGMFLSGGAYRPIGNRG